MQPWWVNRASQILNNEVPEQICLIAERKIIDVTDYYERHGFDLRLLDGYYSEYRSSPQYNKLKAAEFLYSIGKKTSADKYYAEYYKAAQCDEATFTGRTGIDEHAKSQVYEYDRIWELIELENPGIRKTINSHGVKSVIKNIAGINMAIYFSESDKNFMPKFAKDNNGNPVISLKPLIRIMETKNRRAGEKLEPKKSLPSR